MDPPRFPVYTKGGPGRGVSYAESPVSVGGRARKA